MTWLDEQPADKVDAALARLRANAGNHRLYVTDYAGGDERFGLWLALVDRRMGLAVGLGHRDIGDWTWRDAFDGGDSPTEAAREALMSDDTYAALFGNEEPW